MSLDIDVRHFLNMIEHEVATIQQEELNRFANVYAEVVDLNDPSVTSDCSRRKVIYIKSLCHYSKILLKTFLLFDWNPQKEFESDMTVFSDKANETIDWCLSTNELVPHVKVTELPGTLDLMSSPPTSWVRRVGLAFIFVRIQSRVNAVSSVIRNLGLDHPPVFGLVHEKMFKR